MEKNIQPAMPVSKNKKWYGQWENTAIILSILFLVILGISSFLPKERLWGINHLSYYPLWFRISVISIGLLIFIPLVNQILQKVLKKYIITAFSLLVEKRKYLGYPIIIFSFILFFHLFRTRTHFLGDGASIISYINSGVLSTKWTQPLGIWIYLSAYHLLNRFSNFDAATLFTLISYLCGAVFVFFALRLAKLLGQIASTKLFVFLVLLFMGGIQLFFGYAEYYPLLYSGILIYLFYSIKYLEREVSLFLPLSIFLVLLPIHFSSLYLFPSAIFIFLFGREENKSVFKSNKVWVVSAVLIPIFAFLIFYFRRNGWYSLQFILPLFKGNYYAPDYTLFSLPHLLDFLNQQFLVSPIGFLLFLIFLILRPKSLDLKDKTFQFLLIVSIFQLLFNFVIDPGLGAARDWDLFASTGLGYTVLALYVFSKIPPHPKINYLKSSLTIVILIFTLPWIGINANANLSVERFRNLLDLDLKKSRTGHYILAAYLDSMGKIEEVYRENRIQMEKFPEIVLVIRGIDLMNNGNLNNAYLNFQQALRIAPDFLDAHWALGEYYLKVGDLDKAQLELERVMNLNPQFAQPYVALGIIYFRKNELSKAKKTLHRAITLGVKNDSPYYTLGTIYLLSGDLNKAILFHRKAIEINDKTVGSRYGLALDFFYSGKLQESLNEANQAIQINPHYAPAYYLLGTLYDRAGMKEKSISALKECLRLDPTGPLAKNAEQLISEIQRVKN